MNLRNQLAMRTPPVPTKPSLKLAAICAAGMLALGNLEMAALGQNQPPMSKASLENANKQVEALMLEKAHRTKTQQKLDSQLIFAAKKHATGVVHAAAPKLQPSLKAEDDGRIKVDIKGTVTPGLLAAIQSAGGTIISSLPDYQEVQATLPVQNIEAVAGRHEVRFIRPAQKPMYNTGSVDSEGDTTHQAIQARATYGATGAGIKVGVISDSIDDGAGALAAAIASGNIDATNTFTIPGQAGTGEGEGLAMCEIVHDLAPQATIYFATADPNDAQMAANVVALAQAGCKVIIDDLSFPDESPFQDGVIARAVKTVTDMGVIYFSCARNSGNKDDSQSCTWEGDFVNGGSAGSYGQAFHAFSTGVIMNPIGSGGSSYFADLFWSDPLGASTNDYDLYMFDGYGDVIYSSINSQNGTQDPYEHIDDTAGFTTGYYFAIVQYSGTGRFLHLDFGRGRLQYNTAGCIRGHNACDAVNSFTVAATPASTAFGTGNPTGPYPNPFNSADQVEFFSSDGPRRMFYNFDGTPITPGNFSSTGGKLLMKPEIAAADGVSTTLPLNGGLNPFFGTSAAAPHAGAIAALVMSYNPYLTPAQVRNVLTNSCIDIMGAGWDRDSGYGILMARAALQNTPPPSSVGPPPTLGVSTYSNYPVVFYPPATGRSYLVQMSTNLTGTNWITVTNGIPFNGLQITNAPTPAYFRVIYN
jgi:hypothetical protein